MPVQLVLLGRSTDGSDVLRGRVPARQHSKRHMIDPHADAVVDDSSAGQASVAATRVPARRVVGAHGNAANAPMHACGMALAQ